MEYPRTAPRSGIPAKCPMYSPDFAANPHATYDRLRANGPAGPVELAPQVDANLVTDYHTALKVLQNTSDFVRDPRRWKALNEGRVPMDSPVLPMMMYRPNTLFTDGAVHLRLRKAVTDSLDRVNLGRLRRDVEPVAAFLIDQFSERGRADLLNDYAKLLPLLIFNRLLGCPADLGDRLTSAIAAIFDGRDVVRANEELTRCFMELITLKRRTPGEDVTSWLIQHPSGLNDQELTDQLLVLMAAGVEPERNLISSSLLLLLTSQASGRGAGLLTEEAVERVLWDHPPIANYATHYPVHDVDLGGVVVEAGTPLVISFAAANSDPALKDARLARSKEAHLAWGAGAHSCPAKSPAQVIALAAIEAILNALPDLTLAVPARELQWRPGPFHRALEALPVQFTPTPGTRVASLRPQVPAPAPGPAQDPALLPAEAQAPRITAPPVQDRERKPKKGFWSTFLDLFRV
jgi:cytochrome P450